MLQINRVLFESKWVLKNVAEIVTIKYYCLIWWEHNFFQSDSSFAPERKFIKFQILNQCVYFWSRQQNIALSLRKLFFTRDQCAHNIRTPHKVSSKTVVWDHYKGCSITECWDLNYICTYVLFWHFRWFSEISWMLKCIKSI